MFQVRYSGYSRLAIPSADFKFINKHFESLHHENYDVCD